MDITAKLTNGDRKNVVREITVQMDMPETLAALVEKFGESVVLANAIDNLVIGAQAFLRSQLAKDGDKRMTDQQIVKAFAEWKPGVRKSADPAAKMEKIKKLTAGMDRDTLRKLLKELREG